MNFFSKLWTSFVERFDTMDCQGYQCTERVHIVMIYCPRCRRRHKDAQYLAEKQAREVREQKERE